MKLDTPYTIIIMVLLFISGCKSDGHDNDAIEQISPNSHDTDSEVIDINTAVDNRTDTARGITSPLESSYVSAESERFENTFKRIIEMFSAEDYSKVKDFFSDAAIRDDRPGTEIVDLGSCTDCPELQFEKNFPAYSVTLPIDWSADPYSDKTWQLYFHALEWLYSSLQSEDVSTMCAAFAVINDWIDANLFWPGKNSRYQWGDHATAMRLGVLTEAYRIYVGSDFRDDQFRSKLLLAIAAHGYFLASDLYYARNSNHGIMSDLAIMNMSAGIPEFKDSAALFDWGKERAASQFEYAFTVDGVHKEHSPCYHILVSALLSSYTSLIKEFNSTDFDLWLNLYEHTFDFTTHVLLPNGSIPSIGDCLPAKAVNKQSTAEDKLRDAIAVYENSGWAIFRSDWEMPLDEQSYAAIQSDFLSKVHYHEDDTSFILFSHNAQFIVDPSYHSYNNEPIDLYGRTAMAHNVLIVDEANFNSDLADVNQSGIVRWRKGTVGKWRGIVELTHPHYIKIGVNVSRQFAQLNDTSFFVKDILLSDTPHRYTQQYHLAEHAVCAEQGNAVIQCTWPEHNMGLWFKTDETATVEVVEGQTNPMMGWYFPAFYESVPIPVLRVTIDNALDLDFKTFVTVSIDGAAPNWTELESLASEAVSSL